jgi:putative heme-binding domain-containing protein
VVLKFLNDQNLTEIPEADKKTFMELIVAFSHDSQLQRWMADKLSSSNVADAEKGILLDAMSQSRMKEFPTVWRTRLGELLKRGNSEMQERVVALIERRRILGLETQLGEIYANTKVAPSFRLKALGARMISNPKLSDSEFSDLVTFLDSGQVSTLRQSAVRILNQADLDDQQELHIARTFISQADAFLLPSLVSVFEGSKSADAVNALITELSSSAERLGMLSLPDFERIVKSWDAATQESASALVNQISQLQAARLSALEELEKSLAGGDVSAGRNLFYSKALCSTCHAVTGNGANFGPDLTNIGEIRSQHDILEAIVYPSASFAREYETSRVVTSSSTYTGIVKEQLPESIVLESGPGIAVRIPMSDIKSIEPQPLSLMPPGLHQQLSTQELSDLMAYLRSLPDGLGHLSVKR